MKTPTNFNNSIEFTHTFLNRLKKYDLRNLKQGIAKINHILDLRNTDNTRKRLNFTSSPFIFRNKDYSQLTSICRTMHIIIEKVVNAWIEEDTLIRNFFQVPDCIIPLIYKQHQHWQTYARYDFIITTEGDIKLNEFNSASPGAIVTCGLLNTITRKLILKLDEQLHFMQQPMEEINYFASIIERLERNAGIKPATIAVLYDDHYMLFELFEFAKQLKQIGRNVIISHVNQCKYKNKKLILNGEIISTVVNNFFLRGKNLQLDQIGYWQTLSENNITHPYWSFYQAVRDHSVLLTHGFGASLLIEDKRLFFILRSDIFSYLFTSSEKAIIDAFIPLTFSNQILTNNHEIYHKIICQKDQYVFKSALSGAGLGVILGESVSKSEWITLLKKATVPYAIQERITPNKFRIIAPKDLILNHNLSYYVVLGELAGCHSRVSDHPIVTAQATNRSAYCQPVLVEE